MDQLRDVKLSATPLHGRLAHRWDGEPVVLRVTRDPTNTGPSQCLVSGEGVPDPSQFGLCLLEDGSTGSTRLLPEELRYLGDGDVLRVNPQRGEIWVMYRRSSRSNSILLTERCNSWCVMCSQPPKLANDDHLFDAWLRAIPLMAPDTGELGITGGEPTLLGDRFLDLIRTCSQTLPDTGLHVLTNGRKFNYISFARELAAVEHRDLMLGVPVYSDLAWHHDYIVQAEGAFDQTIRGLLNLARCRVRVELRVVIHRHSIERLVGLCEFITRNLPFAEQVALMGLEPIGFAKTNLDSLWLDPADYQEELRLGVRRLVDHGMKVSIYNHQLCVLPPELWPYARQSISDWKNIYLPQCSDCSVRLECAGFFHSAVQAHSRNIHPVSLSMRSSAC